MSKRPDLKLLKDAIDIHVHSSPSLFHRQDTEEVVTHARNCGIKAMILKSHHHPTVDRVTFVKKQVSGIDVFHSITLNYAVGGINPFAVDVALKMGARCVWLPTIDAAAQKDYYGALGGYGTKQSFNIPSFYQGVAGISILEPGGELIPEVMQILDLVQKANCILAVGHLTLEEIRALVFAAKQSKFKKMVIDHPHFPFCKHSLDDLKKLVSNGAILNFTFSEVSSKWYAISPEEIAEQIKVLGPQHIVLSSDSGQVHNPLPAEGLRIYFQLLLEAGVDESEIYTMSHDNPEELVYG